MGEYGRKQRIQLSRVIANSGNGNRQLKELDDNRRSLFEKTIQFLRSDLSAENASNAVIEEMNEDDEHTWETVLLAGWGDAYVSGHSGDVSDDDREKVTNKAEDKDVGCHVCGVKDPGTKTLKYIPDHQPPKVLKDGGYTGSFRFYPHCLSCSNKQGRVVNEYKRRMIIIREATASDWATGLSGSLFWRP